MNIIQKVSINESPCSKLRGINPQGKSCCPADRLRSKQRGIEPEEIKKPTANWGKRIFLIGILWTATGISSIAHASLGGDASSIETDRLAMRAEKAAKQTPSSNGGYTVHEITVPSGTLVRQYASSAGVVFAVTWKGPFIPNLQQILGDHFQTLVAHQSQQRLVGHRSVSHHTADLVIESSGHPRSYVGRAYLPSAIPAGMSTQDIQ